MVCIQSKMESRGKRLVSLIKNKPEAVPEGVLDPGPSTLKQGSNSPTSCCSSILGESREKIAAEMERILFDSDDSVQDPTYDPDPDSLIQPEELFEELARKKKEQMEERDFLRFYGDDTDYTDEAVPAHDAQVMVPQKSPDTQSIQIGKFFWELLITKVFDSTRKRKRWMNPEPENWKVNVAKRRRTEGLPYTTRNKERSAKIPKEIDCERCFYKCNIISSKEREELCRNYWSLSFVEKKNFILNNVTIEAPKKVLAIRGPRKQRKHAKKCFFFHKGEKKQVCQKFFCHTLAISQSVLNDAVQKRNELGLYNDKDKRGTHEPPNKTKEADVKFVKKHIESFPTMEPHYIRKSFKRLYLEASLSIKKLHQLYIEKCTEENMAPVSEITYRSIFCNDYNLSFFVPKKDQCLTCSNYMNGNNDVKAAMKTEYEEHLARKQFCNLEKQKDKERAVRNNDFCCVTFDLQAVLQIPSGLVGQLYYCRKLCVYNLCIYEAALPNDAFCFAWSEVSGKRGSSEIGSILYHYSTVLYLYLSKCVPSYVTEVCLYSDTCGGQNRNQYVAALLLFAVQNIPHIAKIEHKFLESGHSYMEVDSMHSSIESAKKNSEVYCMPDYMSIFKRARSKKTVTVDGETFKKTPYKTNEFKFNEFYDLKKLANDTMFNRCKDSDGNKVKWLKIKRMQYLKEEQSKIYFNYDMSDNLLCIDVKGALLAANPNSAATRTTRGKTRTKNSAPQASPTSVQLKQLYNKPLPISAAKKKDLLGLCNKKIIPEEYHGWYSSLQTHSGADCLPSPAVGEESSAEE